MIFAIFGGCWLLLSCAYSGRFQPFYVGAIVAGVALLLVLSIRVQRQSRGEPEDTALAEEKKRNDRVFAVINGVTYFLVSLLFLVLPRVGLSNYVFPGFVALVGLHFFPMPPLYQHRANLVVGGFMVLWAVVCAVVFRSDGNRVASVVALGAGVALWASSGWALQTASRLLRSVRTTR